MNNLFITTLNRMISKTAKNFKILNLEYSISRSYPKKIRCYSNYYSSIPRPRDAFGQSDFDEYQSHFPEVVEHFMTSDKLILPEVKDYFKEIMSYTVPGHEQATGPLALLSYKNFALPEKHTPENIRLAFIMGWVHDMIGSSFQVLDDVLDSSETRINKPCWYKNDNVGLKAVQHSAALGDGAFMILSHFFSDHPNYIPIVKLTEEIKFKTSLGQILDLMSEKHFQFFTKEKYRVEAMYRGAFLSLIHPTCSGMYLAGVCDQKLHSEVRAVLCELGAYFAAQNDILDCYGKPEMTGKFGNDIQVGKSTWLSAQALTDGSPLHKDLFRNHYGKPNLESQGIIFNLYKELDILGKFLKMEEDSYSQIRDMIESMSDAIPKELMQRIVTAIYGKFDRVN